jgi:hypothetical protein
MPPISTTANSGGYVLQGGVNNEFKNGLEIERFLQSYSTIPNNHH